MLIQLCAIKAVLHPILQAITNAHVQLATLMMVEFARVNFFVNCLFEETVVAKQVNTTEIECGKNCFSCSSKGVCSSCKSGYYLST